MVDTANAGLVNSKVNGQIRLVHTMQVNYTDTNTNDAALGQLTGYDSDTQQQTTPNAAFNALRAAREQYGADLASLVRPFRIRWDSCGIAWLVGGGKQPVTATNGWDFFGYSVVSDGTDRNEQDGKTYYCEEHTLAHESATTWALRSTTAIPPRVATASSTTRTITARSPIRSATSRRRSTPSWPTAIRARRPISRSPIRAPPSAAASRGVNNSEDNARSLGQ